MWPFTKKKIPTKVISGMMPTEEGIAFFKPLVTFSSEDFGGTVYVKEQNYTLRKHNLKLAQCLHKWMQEGKVHVVTAGEDPLLKVLETGVQE